MADAFLSFLALVLLSVFFASLRGVSSGAAPLLALSSVMVLFTLAGIAGGLVPFGWVFYGACFLLGAFALWRGGRALLLKMASPGFMLFLSAGLVLLVYFGLRQPVYSQWDEFVFWGMAPKLIKLHGRLYTPLDVGFFWTPSERPGLPLLGWFVQFFGSAFAPWKVYWAYGLLAAATAAALTIPFGRRHWEVALPVGLAGLLVPFFFMVPYNTVRLAPVYLSAYADLPGGLLFGATLALYFSACRSKEGGRWQAALPLCALALVKENILPVALVAAGIMATDSVFFGLGKCRPKWQGKGWQAALRLGAGLGYFALPLVLHRLWGGYVGRVHQLNPYMHGNMSNEPVSVSVVRAFKELFGLAPKSDTLIKAMGEMGDSFFGRVRTGEAVVAGAYRVSMAGTALVTLLLVAVVWVVAVALAKDGHGRRVTALAGFLMLGGFAAYHFMLLVNYAFISHTRFDEGIADYGRYILTYFVGLFMLGLFFAAKGATDRGEIRPLAARGVALVLAVFMVARFSVLVRPGYSVLDYPANVFDSQRTSEAEARRVAAAVQPGSRLFFVSQGGDGGEYFQWHYHLLPLTLMYSITGGGTFAPPPAGQEALDTPQNDLGVSLDEMRGYLADNDCQYILILRLDEGFAQSYSVLFEGGLKGPLESGHEGPLLFQRGANGLYHPVPLATA